LVYLNQVTKEVIKINILKLLGLSKEKKKASKNVAKERLQFILVQDRVKLSPSEMESLKNDLMEVISKYIEVEEQEIEMEVDRVDGMMALRANFPFK